MDRITIQPEAIDTVLLDGQLSDALEQAASILLAGGLVAFPTDTVYGLGALVWNPASVARIYWAKDRPSEKAIPVLLADLEQTKLLGAEPSSQVRRLAERFWPGPLTLVLPCGPHVPEIVTAGTRTVAVRVPDHPVALRLFELVGQPLAVTSANRSGHTSHLTAGEVMAQLAGRIDAVIDGGACPGGVPSTVLDLTTTPARVLRQGPVTAADLASLVGETEPF
ncbi:MAG TPA: L-threonylcarbamoyladenylate synthase [Anaerolineae bacterium]|nr:L-threonylcarbamoyladenylate synthase [Anaerolineae bacterium]